MADDKPIKLATGDFTIAREETPRPPSDPHYHLRFQPQFIRHVKFVRSPIRQDLLYFGIEDVEVDASVGLGIQDVERYASSVARGGQGALVHGQRTTPFDVTLDQQCYLIIELDRLLNWRFLPGSHGVTRKLDKGDSDFGLKIYRTDGSPSPEVISETTPGDRDCYVALWSVRQRGHQFLPDARAGWHGFNVYVELIQEWSPGKYHRMPTVFDPDVGNNGGTLP